MRERWISLLPSLVLAAGILAGSMAAVSVTGWWVVIGPIVIAVALLAAVVIGRRAGSGASMKGVLILAGAVVAAGVMMAWDDPADVVAMIPVFGAAAAVPVVLGGRRCEPGAVTAGSR